MLHTRLPRTESRSSAFARLTCVSLVGTEETEAPALILEEHEDSLNAISGVLEEAAVAVSRAEEDVTLKIGYGGIKTLGYYEVFEMHCPCTDRERCSVPEAKAMLSILLLNDDSRTKGLMERNLLPRVKTFFGYTADPAVDTPWQGHGVYSMNVGVSNEIELVQSNQRWLGTIYLSEMPCALRSHGR